MNIFRKIARTLLFFLIMIVGLLNASSLTATWAVGLGGNVVLILWLFLCLLAWLGSYGALGYAYGLIRFETKSDVFKAWLCAGINILYTLLVLSAAIGALETGPDPAAVTGSGGAPEDTVVFIIPVLAMTILGTWLAYMLAGLCSLILLILGGIGIIILGFRWREWLPLLRASDSVASDTPPARSE